MWVQLEPSASHWEGAKSNENLDLLRLASRVQEL